MPDQPTQIAQGTAGSTDVVVQLQGIVRQLSSGYQNMVKLIAAVQDLTSPVKSYTVATLPSSPSVGMLAAVTDGGSGAAWGSTPTGGASTRYLCWYNGSAWTIIGK